METERANARIGWYIDKFKPRSPRVMYLFFERYDPVTDL